MKRFIQRYGWAVLFAVAMLAVQGCHSKSGGFSP